MENSVESVCNLLARSRLLPAREVRALHERWRGEASDGVADLARFGQWLVGNRFVTEYQADRLLRGKAGNFFLNDYKILAKVGQGHMAAIYRAVHPLGATVALKVLPPSRAGTPKGLARFQREGRIGLRLDHPNVVRTLHTGRCEDIHFLVLEYLEGESLAEALRRRGPLPPEEAARLVQQALTGLQHVHEQGVVHRDLKPANLMLVPEIGGDGVTVKILDLGLARCLEEEKPTPGSRNGLTKLGSVLGTPEYRAPEQERDSHAADVRADIYSLGCVLYACLAGAPPFADSDPRRRAERHAHEAPRPLREVNAAVPDALQDVVDGMLAKDPTYRYPTPERAAAALEAYLASIRPPLPAPIPADPVVAVESLPVATPAASVPEVDVPHGSVAPVALLVEPAPAVPVATVAATASWGTFLLIVGVLVGTGVVFLVVFIGWRVLLAFALGTLVGRLWGRRRRKAVVPQAPPAESGGDSARSLASKSS